MTTSLKILSNGFYTSNSLSKKLKASFIKDAISLSYKTACESKYTDNHPSSRIIDDRLTLDGSITLLLKDKKATLDCIDRFAYNRGIIKKELCEYEICFHTLDGPNNGWLLVYIFVNEKSFNLLIKKYNLKLK